MYAEAPEHLQTHLSLEASAYEIGEETIDTTVDDICVKEQKSTGRKRSSKLSGVSKSDKLPVVKPVCAKRKGGKKVYKKRKFAYSTVIHFQSSEGQYGLCTSSLKTSVHIITAFLLNNNGLKKNWLFHVDGQRTLQDCLLKHFSWHNCRLLLDWYHLRKKIQRQLFMALYTTDERDAIMNTLFVYGWNIRGWLGLKKGLVN